MLEKYILSRHRVVNESLVENGKGWRQILYSFFKNSGETYFNFKCKSSKSQSEYVQKRRQIRIELQRKHYVSIKPELQPIIQRKIFISSCDYTER